jgi:ABC-type phosphate transport system substrate-binding protein
MPKYPDSRLETIIIAFVVFLVLAGIVLPVPSIYAADYVLVANNDVSVDRLSEYDVRAIFLGEKLHWADGRAIRLVILEGGEIHKAFLHDNIGKTPEQFFSYWQRQVFNGRALAPRSFDKMADVVVYVATHSGAVGYVSADYVSNFVKTLSIDQDN